MSYLHYSKKKVDIFFTLRNVLQGKNIWNRTGIPATTVVNAFRHVLGNRENFPKKKRSTQSKQ